MSSNKREAKYKLHREVEAAEPSPHPPKKWESDWRASKNKNYVSSRIRELEKKKDYG